MVSEPPEEQEDGECEEVGVAFLRIPDILEQRQDLTETSLSSEHAHTHAHTHARAQPLLPPTVCVLQLWT